MLIFQSPFAEFNHQLWSPFFGGKIKQAVYWFNKAAEQGDADRKWSLGQMYALGRNVIHDDAQATYWFRKATEQNEAYQFTLGHMYKDGRGVLQDDEQAIYWLRKAAERGDGYAQLDLDKLGVNWKTSS